MKIEAAEIMGRNVRIGVRSTVLDVRTSADFDDVMINGQRYLPAPDPIPEPTPDEIDWSHVAAQWKWMARGEDGYVWIFDVEPRQVGGGFVSKGGTCVEVIAFASYRRGTCHWRDSLVQRPEGV